MESKLFYDSKVKRELDGNRDVDSVAMFLKEFQLVFMFISAEKNIRNN